MKYRLAGASYRAIAEKLTEERAQAYADEHGVSFERAMKQLPHVSKRTAWDDVTAELEELRRRDGDAARGPGGVPLLIRFRGPHDEQHAVAVAGVRHVGPAQGGDFRPPQPAHKQQAGDHGVESAPALRRGVGFDAPAVRAGTGGGGENRGEPVRAQRGGLAPAPVGGRATVAAQHAGGRFPGGGRLAGELGPKPDGGDG